MEQQSPLRGVVFDELRTKATVRFDKPITLTGFIRYGRDADGNILMVEIQTRNGTSYLPFHETSVEEKPTSHYMSEVTDE